MMTYSGTHSKETLITRLVWWLDILEGNNPLALYIVSKSLGTKGEDAKRNLEETLPNGKGQINIDR